MSGIPTYLRRYTDLPGLLHLLTTKQITLLDPMTWDDRNDSFFMSLYKDRKYLKSVLALCFSQSPETYHHWRVYSNGPAGACIVFNRKSLLRSLTSVAGVSTGHVKYLTLKAAERRTFDVDELPFVKRNGFKPETEFRALFVSKKEEKFSLQVPIEVAAIRSISLSPWMHGSLANSTIAAIRAIDGCKKLRVSRSTLISNEKWKALGRNAS